MGLALVLLAAGVAVTPARAESLRIYVVTSAEDRLGGTCSDLCTLREAIVAANDDGEPSAITFDIDPVAPEAPIAILPLTELPAITSPLSIDGTASSGLPGVKLIGAFAGMSPALRVTGGGTTIRGLAIDGFAGDGIRIEGPGGNRIVGNHIGLEAAGTWLVFGLLQMGGSGVVIDDSPGNVIGGTAPGDRNVISGNRSHGVVVRGPEATNNVIKGNYIGVDATGTEELGNNFLGISIAAPSNVVGGPEAGARNILSGNGTGIEISGDQATGNIVQGNYVGTDVTGTAALGNKNQGIRVADGASLNAIGGDVSGAGNLVSGNVHDGISVADVTCTGNVVQGNLVGVDATGTNQIRNTNYGVSVYGQSNLIGGRTSGARNVVSGNAHTNIYIGFSAADNRLEGNFIGTDPSGTTRIPNDNVVGIEVRGSSNLIGGVEPGARNVVSGNDFWGIFINSSTGNVVRGNYIGVDVTGSRALGNGIAGVYFSFATGNVVGGTDPGEGNVISGNGTRVSTFGAGVHLEGSRENLVQGNLVGTDAAGQHPIPNTGRGIALTGSTQNVIGGTSPGASNVISGTDGDGVHLEFSADANVIQGNFIGTGLEGQLGLGNRGHGIHVRTQKNTIGGTAAGAANVIVNNGFDGIMLHGAAMDTRISGNVITGNAGLGIDMWDDGVTANDAGDSDEGVNDMQNFPDLAAVSLGDGTVTVSGAFDSTASRRFTLEFFTVAACDPSGHGEGERYLGSLSVRTGADGLAAFTHTFPAPPGELGLVVATATAPQGSTSEFSACRDAA